MAELKIKADSGGGTVALKGPATTTGNAAVQLTLPVDDGTTGQYLKTDGSGALSWATVTGTTINNNADNRVITGSGTANTLEAESSLTWNGSQLDLNYTSPTRFNRFKDDQLRFNSAGTAHIDHYTVGQAVQFRVSESSSADTNAFKITSAGHVHFGDGKGLIFGTNENLTVRHSTNDTSFTMTPVGYINFNFDGNDATTSILMRIQKTGDAANNVRHSMFSFGLPGVNRGLAQCGSSNSEAPQWAASSDYRIKENFRAYTGGWDAIKAIPVQLYDEKSPSYWTQGADKKDMKGWRAHEVQAVIPEAVTGAKDAVVTQELIDAGLYEQSELNHIIPQQLGTSAMLPTVIGALQQAMAKIETLETKVAALEAG